MKAVIFFILATIITQGIGRVVKRLGGMITKEQALKDVTVQLVKKTWMPEDFDPGTDEPLQGFPGSLEEFVNIYRKDVRKFGHVPRPLTNATSLFFDPNFNSSQPTVILTHPMTVRVSAFIARVINVLALRNLHKHYNVIAMHAPWLSWQYQISCARMALGLDPMIQPVAEAFASFLLNGINIGMIKPHQISFIGFSYSATLNAYIARIIRNHTGYLTHTLLALDAYQYNKNNRFFKPLTKEDAMYVHLIHSSSKVVGTMARRGTVDIVLNNGYFQPGCKSSYNVGAFCSHRRSVPIFIFAVLALGNVVARQCDSWEKFHQCKCSKPSHPLLIVSFPVNEEARGTFYLRTDSVEPFVLGPKGAFCKAEVDKLHRKLKHTLL